MTTLPAWLAQVKARAEKANDTLVPHCKGELNRPACLLGREICSVRGNWCPEHKIERCHHLDGSECLQEERCSGCAICRPDFLDRALQAFIAAARQDVPALVKIVEAQDVLIEAQRNAVRRFIDNLKKGGVWVSKFDIHDHSVEEAESALAVAVAVAIKEATRV